MNAPLAGTAAAPEKAPGIDSWPDWDATVLDLITQGHGHVLPRPDGMAAQCCKAPECPWCLQEVRVLREALSVLMRKADDGRAAIYPLAHGVMITQPTLAILGEAPPEEVSLPQLHPEPHMFDVFPGQLRLDPGEPL